MLKFTCCDAAKQFSTSAQAQVLRGITRGFERECLRVDATGRLALTPHPRALGSKLTHPWITTDYSEALLEFITPPSQDPDFPLQFLRDIHRFSARQLQGEVMWAGSMPCVLGSDQDIPIADYGSSHAARFKTVYREGLGLRYGRQMQTIAGAHYNWSLPDEFWQALKDCCADTGDSQAFVSARYFGLIRNFLRFGWLIPYLFGASPAICQSFLQGRKSSLQELVPGTLYGPHATSLRMGDLGYQNRAQAKLHVSVNSSRAGSKAKTTKTKAASSTAAASPICNCWCITASRPCGPWRTSCLTTCSPLPQCSTPLTAVRATARRCRACANASTTPTARPRPRSSRQRTARAAISNTRWSCRGNTMRNCSRSRSTRLQMPNFWPACKPRWPSSSGLKPPSKAALKTLWPVITPEHY